MTYTVPMTLLHRLILRVLQRAPCEWFAAARGTATRGSCERRAVAGARLTAAPSTLVFGWPEI